jgi:hypothetical protein
MSLVLAAAMFAAACTSEPSGDGPVATGASPGTGASPSATGPAPEPVQAEDFDPANFSDSATVDHRLFPLVPGTRYTYEGSVLEDGERVGRSIVITVTDLTKEIAGVQTAVSWDLDYDEGDLVEAELAFFAQDDEGNVWRIGEYPEEYDGGKFDKAPAWFHGLEGATAGIVIRASPQAGEPGYAQGFAPKPVGFDDRGRTYEVGASTCVPVDCYDDVVIIEEFEPSKPGAFQLKYYAPDVGNVRVGWRGRNEKERERMVLVRLERLTPEELLGVREQAFALERSGYRRSDVYAQTSPAVPLSFS